MIEYNTRLNNFFGVTLRSLQKQVSAAVKQESRFSISCSGKFHEIHPVCLLCGSMAVVDNGNEKCKSKVIRELGLVIKRGKCKCKRCGNTWTTHYEEAEFFVQQYKRLIRTTVFHLCTCDLSLDAIAEHVLTVFGKQISHEWVRQIYISCAKEIEQKKVLRSSGIFDYDEQYLKLSGKSRVRVVVIDAVSRKVIFDETAENDQIETLKDKLRMRMLPYRKEVFIVDMAKGYPKMLKELFPDAKIQWCIFHLNQRIVDEDCRSLKKLNQYGKNVLPVLQEYNLYLLLNIFFNHDVEIRFLKRQLEKLDNHGEMLKGCGCYDESMQIISAYEMRLLSEFYEFRKSLKKNRRKHDKYLLRRDKEETTAILQKLEKEISFFPKELQKRIRKIIKDIDKFTVFQDDPRVPPTNNNIEQYYSATLQKTEKKRFRSEDSINTKLKIVREKWNQTMEKLNFNFIGFLQLFAKLHCFFGNQT
jgi:hypothetical protein